MRKLDVVCLFRTPCLVGQGVAFGGTSDPEGASDP